ncbi:MAG: histidine--tRNA ligase [Patescibacteria group bacterium]|jgi:histidyl-tRNA synthetase
MEAQRLSTQPYKGTRDLFPEDLKVQSYIFDTWRRVCKGFGYEEYQTPLLEPAEIYRAKSGEDIGGRELYTLTDMGGRELALRPELTPSVTRMVCRKYKELPKPIRLFSIGSFYRSEAPQRGRNREFWQLNADIFGESSLNADIEILQLALELMLAFNPPTGSFRLYLSNRKLLNSLFDLLNIENRSTVSRILDKYQKLPADVFEKALADLDISGERFSRVKAFMEGNIEKELESSEGYNEIRKILAVLEACGYKDLVEFRPSLIRGFDYYDGMVFEVFDMNKENTRSLFGGGRYNGLARIFGSENFPAVGFAPGDETTRLFLETWGLIPNLKDAEKCFLFAVTKREGITTYLNKVAQRLRTQEGKTVVTDLSENIEGVEEGLRETNKKGFRYAVFVGDNEFEKNGYTLKDLSTGDQTFSNL